MFINDEGRKQNNQKHLKFKKTKNKQTENKFYILFSLGNISLFDKALLPAKPAVRMKKRRGNEDLLTQD